jgi:hypothetical protein
MHFSFYLVERPAQPDLRQLTRGVCNVCRGVSRN